MLISLKMTHKRPVQFSQDIALITSYVASRIVSVLRLGDLGRLDDRSNAGAKSQEIKIATVVALVTYVRSDRRTKSPKSRMLSMKIYGRTSLYEGTGHGIAFASYLPVHRPLLRECHVKKRAVTRMHELVHSLHHLSTRLPFDHSLVPLS